MKRLFEGMISLLLCISMAWGWPAHAIAEEPETFVSGDYACTLSGGGGTITGYGGSEDSLVIPELLDGYPVTGIGERMLDYLPLTSMIIPKSIVEISPYSFSYCHALERIEVVQGNPVFASVDGVLFDQRQGMLVAYPYGRTGESYAIPEGIQTIGKNAFSFRARLTGITIPDSVMRIDHNAFRACIGLTHIIIPGSVASIGESAFENCQGLTGVVLTEGIAEIGDYAFTNCRGITKISIPESIVSIGDGAFIGCDGLTDLTIPASVTSIGENAFSDCKNLSLLVAEGSCAAQYAQENGISHKMMGQKEAPS